jgi:hypothetical protein
LCWCGSGKKYKDCHADADRAELEAGKAQAQQAEQTGAGGEVAPSGGKRKRRRR